MSLRSRPKTLSDRFDSHQKGTFDQKPQLSGAAKESKEYAHTKNLDVFESLEVLSVLLKDFQSKHLHLDSADDFHFWFPYAWVDISEGDEIKNLNTKEIYKVEELVTTRGGIKNYVRIKGEEPPKSWHILRLDDKKAKTINIIPSYPDSEVKPYIFSAEGHLQNEEGIPTWTDTITYSVEKESPGSRESSPFGATRELNPRYRETLGGEDIYNQMVETIVRFDFWTKSNKSSERLRSWFKDFTHKYEWLVKHNGVNRFLWWESFTADKATRWRPDIVHRSASYYLRTEYSVSKNLFTIKDLDVKVHVPSGPNDNNQKDEININI